MLLDFSHKNEHNCRIMDVFKKTYKLTVLCDYASMIWLYRLIFELCCVWWNQMVMCLCYIYYIKIYNKATAYVCQWIDIIFKTSRRVSFSYFPKIALDHSDALLIPFKIFVDHVTIFNSSPMQYLRTLCFKK